MIRYLFLILMSIATTVFSVSAQGISMSPTRLFFTGNPGEVISETVVLHNSSVNDYTFNINYKDWERAIDGTKVYFNSGTLKTSNVSWLSTRENNVLVPAGTTKEVVVSMRIPTGASSTSLTNSMLFFTQISKQQDKSPAHQGIGITALFEFGLHIYYTPSSNEIKSLDITNIEQLRNKEQPMNLVAVSITNDGNTVNDATVEFELTNLATGQEIKLKPIPISMMPNTDQIVEFMMPENISGDFLGVTIIKMAGSNDLRVGEKELKF